MPKLSAFVGKNLDQTITTGMYVNILNLLSTMAKFKLESPVIDVQKYT